VTTTREDGAALFVALGAMVLLSGVGAAVLVGVGAERAIAGNYRGAVAGALAVDAAVEGLVWELAAAPDWSQVLTGARTSAFRDGTHTPTLPSRETLDLDQLTADIQAETNATYPLGPNTPVFRLYGWGTLARLAGLVPQASGAYVAVWTADDPADGDGQAQQDANGSLLLHAEAFGYGRTRRVADVVISRAPAGVRVLSWRTK
jgi:hypothetical protein